MSFDTKYPNRKDWLKPYYNSQRFDRQCRNHGSCGYCESNRTIQTKRALAKANVKEEFFPISIDGDALLS